MISLPVLNQSIDACHGTYDFCRACPASQSCCSRAHPGAEVDAPLLFPTDVREIARVTGMQAETFSTWEGPTCGELRPCGRGHTDATFIAGANVRSTPTGRWIAASFLDILEKADGRLVWIAYTGLCPVPYIELEDV